MVNFLIINGKSTADFGVYITNAGVYDSAERDYDSISVPGRNGNLIIENDRYKNINITYPAFIPDDSRNNYRHFKSYLMAQKGYFKIEDTFQPDVYRIGAVKKGIKPKVTTEKDMVTFEMTFDCKPQLFLSSGEREIIVSHDTVLYNDTCFSAKPFIRLYGTGIITIGKISIEVIKANVYTDIDCETMDAYKGSVNCNGNIIVDEFPYLPPGATSVSFVGFSNVIITPRWWTI